MTDHDQRTTQKRERTYTWDDPRVDPAKVAGMSGLEFMQAMLAGEMPRAPIGATLNFQPGLIEEGRVIFEGTPGEWAYNPIGTVHGGYPATLLDSALGCCIHTMLPKGMAYTTVELKVNMVRAITSQTGTLVCEGKVVHMGRSLATAEARITGKSDGKLYGHGSTTCFVFPMKAG